jgi:hypothetical protein
LDHPLAVRWRDRTPERGTLRQRLARNVIRSVRSHAMCRCLILVAAIRWPSSTCIETRGLPRHVVAAQRVGGPRPAETPPQAGSHRSCYLPVLDDNITFHGVLIQADGDRTRRLAALLADGSLRPSVRHVLPPAAAPEAHRIIESGHADGNRGSGRSCGTSHQEVSPGLTGTDYVEHDLIFGADI